MSSISLRDLGLNQTTITGRRKSNVTVVETHVRRKIDPETRKMTDEIEGYSVDIIAVHGKLQTVKLPTTTASEIEKINAAISNNMIVTANFGEPSTLTGKPYAMLQIGQILSGVSAKAETISIVSIESENDDIDDDQIDL